MIDLNFANVRASLSEYFLKEDVNNYTGISADDLTERCIELFEAIRAESIAKIEKSQEPQLF